MKGIWRRVGETAIPVSPRAKAFLEKIKESGTFTDERNVKQHRLFFVLCQIVATNLDTTVEVIRKRALYKAGYITTWSETRGDKTVLHIEPKSIRDMKQKEFDQCFKDCIPIMAEWLGNAPDELRDEAMARFNDSVDGDLAERIETYAR
jgi:hypothetical protein